MSDHHVQHVRITQRDGFLFEASFDAVPNAAPVLLDEPPPLGGAQAPNAAGLLGAAVGNCLSASLLMCLQKSRAEVSDMTTEVGVRIGRNDKGRLRILAVDVVISPVIAAGDEAKLERCRGLFEEFCTVTASVRQAITVNVTVTERVAAHS